MEVEDCALGGLKVCDYIGAKTLIAAKGKGYIDVISLQGVQESGIVDVLRFVKNDAVMCCELLDSHAGRTLRHLLTKERKNVFLKKRTFKEHKFLQRERFWFLTSFRSIRGIDRLVDERHVSMGNEMWDELADH